MGLRQYIKDIFGPVETRDNLYNALGPGIHLIDGYGGSSPRAAQNLSTVLACVQSISSAMASLPAYVYRFVESNGRVIDDKHSVSKLIDGGPNANQTWSDFVEWVMASVLLRGNALAEIITDNRGAPVGLNPIPWENVSVQLLPNRRLVYDVSDVTYLGGGSGRARRLLADEVFHLKDRSDDGLIGVSRLRRAAAVIEAGLTLQSFGSALYRNGVNPSGALEVDGVLGADARARLQKSFEQAYSGGANAARALILENGLKWKQVSVSPEDAEFLASRKFSTEELCRIFNVPPVIVGDLSNSSFNNTETLTRFFATSTLTPWIRKVEAEFSRSVFSEASRSTHRLELDMSGLLRGSPTERWQSWKIAVEAGILTPNEVREVEGWNPLKTNPLPALTDTSVG